MFLTLALALFSLQSSAELRAALEALRDGKPGESAFEAALPRLPDLLGSKSGWFVESAAHLAGMHGRGECEAALVAALRHEQGRKGDADRGPTQALLDALIRLELAAPLDVLLARPDGELADQYYLALACHEEPERFADGCARLLELGWFATKAHWAAACRLTALEDPRAARWLVAGGPWLVRFAVRDAESEAEIPGSLGGGMWSTSHPMWPPRVQYQLTLPGPEQSLEAITFTRREHSRSGPLPTRLPSPEIIAWRARLLDTFVGRELSLDVESMTAYHERDDAASLASALAEQLASVTARIRAAAEALAAQGILTDIEPLLSSLTFRVELHDLRTDRSLPLEWPPSTATVECIVR